MNRVTRLHGLYAITDTALAQNRNLAEQVAQALLGGARIIQYRDKSGDRSRRQAEAKSLLKLCRKHHALLLINDDLELAKSIGADGIHLGRDDAFLPQARALLGPEAIIGVSCYNQLELAREASRAGADYIAFGRFFPSQTKPDAVQADPELLRQASRELPQPQVAIGGITPENGGPLIDAGADMLAVIEAIFNQTDIRLAAARFSKLFQPEDLPR
ncbi:MAG: thiamine-phosphate synthase [Gammaproteobacteria bacterium (ex Lamellibrachia satsuma)]|nr:MAG: thiamine phosphate synthase [Gammaproteobacteria bacterium (ex Lamellibrachia satsuma)]RRS34008.1 MAG: thiamine-phosphate synthase [Gammaproteobacteria bacterium (ex Lamellibrachia satsuma)]RRS35556.1 MAG: thiamine-phosphate synthase [Gammaproteobacteria bacterium (ex Lamellibrachia satsuma)]